MRTLEMEILIAAVLLSLCTGSGGHPSHQYGNIENRMKYSGSEGTEEWAYVNVRHSAHMFYWLYYSMAPAGFHNVPLVLWLQGGPGGSSTGFGNFEELGPLDVSLKPRNTTWLSLASLLFVDNPVGTGYSYVDRDDAYATNNDMITRDMIVLLEAFFMKADPQFQKVPFYIFSESYGGKMAASISSGLKMAIQSGQIKCNFKGVAMGDSWISPVDSVMTWGPYLYTNSLVDLPGLEQINVDANKTKQLIDEGKWKDATDQWSATEDLVESVTHGVNFYNILKWGGSEIQKGYKKNISSKLARLFHLMVAPFEQDDLDKLMNGPIRQKLKIIPENVQWGGQSENVFTKLSGDFMKPVANVVDQLISNYTDLDVIVYSGQLDLIVDTLGTEKWVHRMKIAPEFIKSTRVPFVDPVSGFVTGYLKKKDNFSFYWVLGAGHMVPADNGSGCLMMLKLIFSP